MVERETQSIQPHVEVAGKAIVPDEFAGASVIAVLFTPGRPKVNYITESEVALFANTNRCL